MLEAKHTEAERGLYTVDKTVVQDEKAWLQASLPVKLGGLGIWQAVQVAPSAYLSSTAATSNLVTAILPNSHHSIPVPSADIALAN